MRSGLSWRASLRASAPLDRLLHAETLPGEVVRQGVQDYRVVLDDQDLRRHLRF
jgi:hypothetical protein